MTSDRIATELENDAQAILAIERAAFERWTRGDPTGFLEASAPEVDYFDPFTAARLDGLEALTALYAPLEGKTQADTWEMVDPHVTVSGDMGLLTFNYVSAKGGVTWRWNTTEVYRRIDGQWKIIHTHWSLTQPELKLPIE